VFTPKLKEINYFAYSPVVKTRVRFRATKLEEYEEFFADAAGCKAVGEVTPLYLTSEVAPRRIFESIPDAKLIAVLRDPVERAYSAFLMAVRDGRQAGDVRDVLSNRNSPYVEQGRYARYLARYYDLFDRRQIRIFRFDDLRDRPAAVVSELYEFLGVDSGFCPKLEVHNQGFVPRSTLLQHIFANEFLRRVVKPLLPEPLFALGRRVRSWNGRRPPGLPPDIRADLRAYYRDDILALEDLTKMDFSSWRVEAETERRRAAC
jgi:hypothetical protein